MLLQRKGELKEERQGDRDQASSWSRITSTDHTSKGTRKITQEEKLQRKHHDTTLRCGRTEQMWGRARNPLPQPAGLTKGKVLGRITLKYSIPSSLCTIKCASWNWNSKPTAPSQLLWKRLPCVFQIQAQTWPSLHIRLQQHVATSSWKYLWRLTLPLFHTTRNLVKCPCHLTPHRYWTWLSKD